ncbi:MAG TPA: hypothetical protein GXX20_07880 [Clostridiaceae bacterium]|nr:hypothetical protein [Clostridiaceae bacterium]
MAFRTNTVLGMPRYDFHPAADGQMGTIVRLYREWKLSGDMEPGACRTRFSDRCWLIWWD